MVEVEVSRKVSLPSLQEKGAGGGTAAAAAHRLLLAVRSLLDLAAHLRRAALITDFDFQAAAVQQEVSQLPFSMTALR